MHAKPGDHLKVSGHRVGDPARHAEILEVRGDHGQPPYYVRWPDGHESLVYPGPDIIVEPKPGKKSAAN
ncbi:MAG TPA: DUF1918 domain-containing protein [Acidimicrobiia bacterium]